MVNIVLELDGVPPPPKKNLKACISNNNNKFTLEPLHVTNHPQVFSVLWFRKMNCIYLSNFWALNSNIDSSKDFDEVKLKEHKKCYPGVKRGQNMKQHFYLVD